jgi:hypothetical protein
MGKRIKTKRVPATTENITEGIINFLNAMGHFAFRVNTTGVWDPGKEFFRKSPNRGTADIICSMAYRKPITGVAGTMIFNIGVFLAVEVKNALTFDTLRDDQKIFRDNVRATNGLYLIAYSYDDFLNWYKTNFPEDESRIKALPGQGSK